VLTIAPLLLAAALLFWGWAAGFLYLGIIMAAALEVSRLTKARWEFTQKDYNQVWNLCAVLFIGVGIYCFAADNGVETLSGAFGAPGRRAAALAKTTRSVLLLFQWFPVIFFPAIAAQAYGSRDKLDFSTFSWILRRRLMGLTPPPEPNEAPGGINVSFIYFGLCLFAASAEKSESRLFLPILGVLVASALFTARSRSFARLTWVATLVVTLAVAFAAQLGIRELHQALERIDSLLMSRFGGRAVDANDTRTALGSIGKLSLSGKIVARLQSPNGLFPPYLREASYNLFRSPFWAATRRDFGIILPETNETTWLLLPNAQRTASLRIAQFLGPKNRLLATPAGVASLEELPVFQLETNRFAALKVQEGPGFVDYVSRYTASGSIDGPPDADDRYIPEGENETLSRIASELGLQPGIDTEEAMRRTTKFFQDNFQYSSYLRGDVDKGETPLRKFLLRHRAGHCELFATATTLLLRKADIPTRYAVGYSIQESKGTKAVVRERHAHAWCIVYYNGQWHDFDTTPGSWASVEAEKASWWEPVRDLWSQAWFAFSKWRYGKTSLRPYIPWIIAPVAIVLVAQLLWRKTRPCQKAGKQQATEKVHPGFDSEFYAIERSLEAQGFGRRKHETVRDWLMRIQEAVPALSDTLSKLVSLHYRLRFDPHGLVGDDRGALRAGVSAWLNEASEFPTKTPRTQRNTGLL